MATVKVNGIDLYFEEHGSSKSPAVVLSTPAFFDSAFYQPIAEQLKDDYHVILYDHRGHGKSTSIGKRPDIESTTQDVIKLIQHLEIDPCHFVGNGLGAHVGLMIAVRRPDLLRSCFLMGALPEGESAGRIKELDQFVETLKHDGMKTGVQSLMHSYFGESFLTSDDSLTAQRRDHITNHLMHLTAHQIDLIKQIFHRPTLSYDELKSVSAFTTVAVGAEETADRQAIYRHLTEIINHSSYQLVPETGYLMSLEKPEEIAVLIDSHIQKTNLEFIASSNHNRKNRSSKHNNS